MINKFIHWFFYILPIIGILSFTALILYGYSKGIFQSTDSLQKFIQQFGDLGIIIFISLQILQVIIPILPGGISTVAGMLMFGSWIGLLYSYIGLIIGEIITYWLTRYYGKTFVHLILSKKKYQQFEQLLNRSKKGIKKVLISTLLIPFAPDDLVCLAAGLVEFPFKDYLKILFLFKFWSITTYGFVMLYLINHVLIH